MKNIKEKLLLIKNNSKLSIKTSRRLHFQIIAINNTIIIKIMRFLRDN